MVYKLKISCRASLEISEAISRYETQQLFLGRNFLKDVYQNLEIITFNPHQFVKNKNFRYALLHRFPSVIVYQVKNEIILVLSMFNTHQNPSKKP